MCFRSWKIKLIVSLLASVTVFWRDASFVLPTLKRWTQTSSVAISRVGSSTFISFCFDRLGDTTQRQRTIFTFARRPLHPVEEYMECAAFTRREWPCQD